MNFSFSNIKIPNFRVRGIRGFSTNPLELWKKFIWFLIFFALVVFSFNAWVYYRYYFDPTREHIEEGGVLMTKNLDVAILRIREKEEKYKNIKDNLLIEDPSIIR